jgi:hypothetical protein
MYEIAESLKLFDCMSGFKQYSQEIKAFGLALEVDEVELMYPPVKFNQEIVFSDEFIYRWPKPELSPSYSCMVRNEEILARETQKFKEAMFRLTSVRELALSCDGGLGCLSGLDINPRFPRRLPRVLRSSKFEPEFAQTLAEARKKNMRTMAKGKTPEYGILYEMMKEAKIPAHQIHDAIEFLLWCEGRDPTDLDVKPDGHDIKQRRIQLPRPNVDINSWLDGDYCPADIERNPRFHLFSCQVEMLWELYRAQRLLIESFVNVLGEGLRGNVFSNLRLLNIARIPALLIPSLAKQGLWDALESVTTLSLGVIPDWHTFLRIDSNTRMTETVRPSDSCAAVFSLLNTQVAKTKSIKELHFEWICGGELAPGINQRGRYVLPAPIMEHAKSMAKIEAHIFRGDAFFISLPHVTKLTLKNCWLTPPALIGLTNKLARRDMSLKHLVLESVSLTGLPSVTLIRSIFHPDAPYGQRWWQWPYCIEVPEDNPPSVPLQRLVDSRTRPGRPSSFRAFARLPKGVPRVFSWADVINEITPSLTIQQQQEGEVPGRVAQAFRDNINLRVPWLGNYYDQIDGSADKPAKRSALKSIVFKSCGYVIVKHIYIDSWVLLPDPIVLNPENGVSREELKDLELRTVDHKKDVLLGAIVPHIAEQEMSILSGNFGMREGWGGIYPVETMGEARADGVDEPGRGRFSGRLTAPDLPSTSHLTNIDRFSNN